MKNLLVILSFLFFQINISAQSITDTKHNLSISGPGAIHAESESEICIFCHTPHSSSPRQPLWNRNDPGFNYTLYNSSTLNANPDQPDGSSILCLSCHDGTIALGNVISRANDITFSGGISVLPSGRSNLSTDLSDDHPISLTYNSALAASDGELNDPAIIAPPVHLENGKLQCISCHDPHMNIYSDFLVASRQNSVLCLYCHNRNGWNQSSHKISNSTWNGSGIDPWVNSEYTTVSENGCENCHTSHNSGSNRLMHNAFEEENCLNCHNGNVASKNIEAQLIKTYNHNVYGYSDIHDPTEPNIVNNMHAECSDCHDPHFSNNTPANAPFAYGFISGVKGVNTDGTSVERIQYEYELCYRCHADSPNKPGSVITRDIEQNNTRLEFDLSNPSFHPIEGPGNNNNVPSLISPYTESSIIYCTGCHASDGVDSPAGPHGSIYSQILKANYVRPTMSGRVTESPSNYALCYSCHDRNVIINSNTNFGDDVHRKHIVEEREACSRCHDAHGISSTQGNLINNSHLINFDLAVVLPNSNGRLEFVDEGEFKGSCYLRCHGENHNPESY